MFTFTENNQQVFEEDVILRYSMDCSSFFIRLLLFLCRGTVRTAAQNFLLGPSLVFLILFCALMYIMFFRDMLLLIPVCFVFLKLILLFLYVSTRRFQE